MQSTELVFTDHERREIALHIETDERVWAPTYYARRFGELMAHMPLAGLRVLDVGCGSGALAILAAKCGATATATDLNPAAVESTRHNAALNGVAVNCYASDGLQACVDRGERFDLIVCNSPSIPGRTTDDRQTREEWAENGPEGRNLLDAVLLYGPAVLRRHGRLLTCSNSEQGWARTEALLQQHWAEFRILQDLVFPMDLTIYAGHLERWLKEGAVWRENQTLLHNVKFIMAYV